MIESVETVVHCTQAIRDMWPDPLASQWLAQYPELFDADDLRLAGTQPRYHFCEWLAAIHIFQRDGTMSLVEKYVYPTHAYKVALLGKRLGNEARASLDDICARFRVQPPDLFVFAPDSRRYWFAEVKGPGDRISMRQRASHEAIMAEIGVSVEVVRVVL